jgi:hypothetical protein
MATGCSQKKVATQNVGNPWLGPMRVAVAPALNFSGRLDFDRDVVADLMASELAQVDGFEVLPVSRVLAVLGQQPLPAVQSPAHAGQIAAALGADALLVFAITEYNPYEPPVIGITAQLYRRGAAADVAGHDPVGVAGSAGERVVASVAAADVPLAQSTHVYNSAHEDIAEAVRKYASDRDADHDPFGARRYTASQQHYLRFCCHETIRELVQRGVDRSAVVDPATVSTVWRP